MSAATVLAGALAGCLGLAVALPGVGAAVIFVVGSLVAEGELLPIWLFLGPMLTFGIAAFAGAAKGRSFRAGVRTGIWAAITVMPVSWAVGRFEELRQYADYGARYSARLRRGAPRERAEALADGPDHRPAARCLLWWSRVRP